MESELIKLNNLGIEEYNKGNFENALNYFKKALLIKEAPSIKNNIANTLNELGQKYFEGIKFTLGEPIKAIGGAILKTSNGDIEVNNTIEARLERYKSILRSEVAEVLFK